MSGFGGGGGEAPKTPPFHPIKIDKIAENALRQDEDRYESFRFPVFPGLMDLRQKEIEDAYKQLTGPLAPEFQREFMRNATVGSLSAYGGGDPYSGMALRKDSAAKGSQSANFTRQTMAKQDYDRTRMESLIQQNPIPGLGLTQQDILSMYVYNTGAQNTWSMNDYSNRVAMANSDYRQQVDTWNSVGSLISGIGTWYSNYNNYYGS